MNFGKEPLSLDELEALLGRAFHVNAWQQWLLLLACLLLAALVSWRLNRRVEHAHRAVLLGKGPVDGALFPLLALMFALAARRLLPDHGVGAAVFTLAIPLLVSLLVIRLFARVLRAAWPDSNFIKRLERHGSWVVWVVSVLWITGLWSLVMDGLDDFGWTFGKVHLTLRNILEGGFTAVLVMVVALWISSLIEAKLMRNDSMDLSMRKILSNVIRSLLLFVGLMFALSAAGIDLTALGVLGGALGVGLGFGLQKLAANYVSGFVILAERSLRIGDMVKVDGFEGKVTDINTRYTVIRSLSGREAIVPNEMLLTQRVENSTLADPRVLLSTLVQVDYGCDVDAVIRELTATIVALPRVLSDPGPAVQLNQFAADGLELNVLFWIRDPENGSGSARSEVNLAILRRLRELGVEIPYPQRVVHGLPAPAPTAAVQNPPAP